ncbi:MAG: YhfC family intramembrane metalloprotease [Anaerolineae bacterium]
MPYAGDVVLPRPRHLAEVVSAQQVRVEVTRTDHTAPIREKIDEKILRERSYLALRTEPKMALTVSMPLLILFILEVLLMIAIPIVAVLWLGKRWSLPLRLALIGAATFVGSQVLHLPANSFLASALQLEAQPLVIQAIVLGLSAGIFEEVARYLVYRFWLTEARTWREGVVFGLGHGGIEAILTGALVVVTLISVLVITGAEDPAALGLPEGALPQVEEFWATPWYLPLLAVMERVMALVLHVSMATLVLLCFHKRHIWPLLAAIVWHAIMDFAAVYAGQRWGIAAAEGFVAVITVGSAAVLWWTRRTLAGESASAE